MDKADRLALAVRLATLGSPFLRRRLQREQERQASIEQRLEVTDSLSDHEALVTSLDEQLAMLRQAGDAFDQDLQELMRELIAAGWTPGTSVAAWIGCTDEELRQAIEEAAQS